MIRKFATAAAAGALALGTLAAFGVGSASAAAPPVLGAVTHSSISCNITAKATLSPSLKNNWVQSQHSSDTDAAVRAVPNIQFASTGPVGVSSKAKGTCSGTATDGTHTFTATSIKEGLAVHTPAVDNPPLNNNGGDTCTGLLAGTASEDVAATYTASITLKGSGAKVAPFTITGATVTPHGLGFEIAGGTTSAPFAGAAGSAQANVDGATIVAVTAAPPTSTSPKAASKCQPSFKEKAGVVTVKAPKGFSKIVVASGTLTLTK